MSMRLGPVAAASAFIVGMTEYAKVVSDTAVFNVGGIRAIRDLHAIADSVKLELDFRDGVGGALDEIRAELKQQAERLEARGFDVDIDIRAMIIQRVVASGYSRYDRRFCPRVQT